MDSVVRLSTVAPVSVSTTNTWPKRGLAPHEKSTRRPSWLMRCGWLDGPAQGGPDKRRVPVSDSAIGPAPSFT